MKHALTTMVGVLTFVPAKQTEIFSVAAELDTDWTAMAKPAVVSPQTNYSYTMPYLQSRAHTNGRLE